MLCEWVGHTNLDLSVKFIRRRWNDRKLTVRETLAGSRETLHKQSSTVTVKAEPKEGRPKLSEMNRKTLDGYLGRDALR